MIYPWQTQQWNQLFAQMQKKQLPHALLFSGMSGLGKLSFAKHFISTLYCEQLNTQSPCEKCQGCCLVKEETHPDILWIRPIESAVIKIDQIRTIVEFTQHSADVYYKTVLIETADFLNINAANALLKTLEEPPVNVIFILVSNESKVLPATILSRCQRVLFEKPNTDNAINWLQQHDKKDVEWLPILNITYGSPLKARQWIEENNSKRQHFFNMLENFLAGKKNIIQLSAEFKDEEAITIIDLLLTVILDILRLQYAYSSIRHIDFISTLQKLTTYSCEHHLQIMNYLAAQRKNLLQGANLNKSLLLDAILSRWLGVAHVSR